MTVDDLRDHYEAKTDMELADRIGVSKGMLSRYRSTGIPLSRQALIELRTNGALKADRHKLEAAAS